MSTWLALRAALHDLELDEPMWVDALFAEGRGLFDAGLGLFVYSYRVEAGARIQLRSIAGQQTAPDIWRALFGWGTENQRALARIYQTGAGSLDDWQKRARQVELTLTRFPEAFEPHG